MIIVNLALGFVLSLLIAAGSARLELLTPGGAAAAVIVGTVTTGFGGWGPALLLGTFFASSSALTRWRRDRKAGDASRAARTAAQVFANGAVAATLAVVWGQSRSAAAAAAFTASIAASTADTWATEIGLLSTRPPRMITTGREVPPGTSGGITWLGTGAAVAGAGVIAGGAWLLGIPGWIPWVAGVGAMLLDSVLGATLEGRRRWITNDTVNLLATSLAAAAGGGFAALR